MCAGITPPRPPGPDPPSGPKTPPKDQAPPGTRHPPCAVHAGRYGQQAGGMHPTGMKSCLKTFWENISPSYGPADTPLVDFCTYTCDICSGFQSQDVLPHMLHHLHARDSSDSPLVSCFFCFFY